MTQISRTLLAGIATMVLFATSPNANATNGIDAARACENNPKCVSMFDKDGSVTIVVGGKVIICASPKAQCTTGRKHKPNNGQTSYEGGSNGKNQGSNAGASGGKGNGGGSDGGGNSGANTGSANTNNAGMSAGGGNSGTIN